MSSYSPQTKYFEIAVKFKKVNTFLFWVFFILSIIFTFQNNNNLITCFSIISLIILNILDIFICNYQEKGESKRRNDFIDNSFDCKYSTHNSIEYYDNDEIHYGLYKALVNVYQNAFFSKEILSYTRKFIIIKNVIPCMIIVIFSFIGFSNSNFALPILQLFFSKYFILDLINTSGYLKNVESVFDSITDMFETGLVAKKDNKVESKIIKVLINYETNISSSKIFLNSKVYKKMNPELTGEWDKIKKRYNIKEVSNI